MSLPQQTRIRLPKIQHGLREGLSYQQIADSCGVTEKTIDRDMKSWVQSGEFEVWLRTEYLDLYTFAKKTNPIKAFEQLTTLVRTTLTRKIEKTVNEQVKVNVDLTAILREYETAMDNAAKQNLQSICASKQMDTTQTTSETS